MKKILLTTVLILLLVSCSGRKQIEKAISHGNYDQAISNALNKLDNNKDKKRKQDYVIMLKDAYYKVLDHDLNTINHLKKDGNPELYQRIFDLYLDLDARQNAIKAVMPLQIGGKNLVLEFNDYSNEIVDFRNKVSEHKYNSAITLIDSHNKFDNREAFRILEYIERINPNYKDVRQLMDVAHHQGTDYVIVNIENQTHQIIPRQLEYDLLDFNTYGLNNYWTVYHANSSADIDYDYAMQLQLKQIQISPERVNRNQLLREKQIVDGWEYLLDGSGNVVQDSLGNDIKIDKIINVRARLFEVNQFKSTRVIAKIVYHDLKINQLLDTFPIDSEFIFENNYATVRGDRRALTTHDIHLLNSRRVHFPTNEQMVFDTGEGLKHKLKDILNSYHLRG